jgi:competence ComEA-like helix-hairpin-helix protein
MKTPTNRRQIASRYGLLWFFSLSWILGLTAATHAQRAPCVCPSEVATSEVDAPLAANVPIKDESTVASADKTKRPQSRTVNSPGVVNLNTATEAELIRLPRIGPSRAKAIVALRARLGGHFAHIEQIIRVRGIGRKTFRALAPMLALQGPTTLKNGPVPSSESRSRK